MPHDYQISRDSQALFITLNTKNRLPVFRKDEIKKVLCDAIDESRKSAGLLLFAYVIMIDHLHLITDQPKPISEVLRVLKGITARRVIDYLKERNYSVSLAKLQHKVRDRNYRYSLWQTEKNVYPIFSEKLFMSTGISLGLASGKLFANSAANVFAGENNETVSRLAFPTSIAKAIVSPNARPKPSTIPPNIPREAVGRITPSMVSHLVAPSP